jgi:hypothetical protein
VFRRHAKGDSEMHFGPALSVVSGNYVAARRRGIVDGIDYGYTGEVGEGPQGDGGVGRGPQGVGIAGSGVCRLPLGHGGVAAVLPCHACTAFVRDAAGWHPVAVLTGTPRVPPPPWQLHAGCSTSQLAVLATDGQQPASTSQTGLCWPCCDAGWA